MADHGGPGTLPRVHRPRAPIMSAPAPLTAPLAPLRPPLPVTLTAPRPESERIGNEYVETPFRGNLLQTPPQTSIVTVPPTRTTSTATSWDHHHHHHQRQSGRGVVFKQPSTVAAVTASFCKEPDCGATTRPSIVCPECGRCRCDPCQQPRPLPQRWICGNGCLLSADAVVDYMSCLCCVKGLFYHCSEGDGGESCADEPCGCGPERKAARWGCLAALSVALPCLWCYWPLRGCKRAVEVCYARHSRQGCRCRPHPTLATPEKRLLDSSPDF